MTGKFVWFSTCRDQSKIQNRRPNSQLLRDCNKPRHGPARSHALDGGIDHRIEIMGKQNAPNRRGPRYDSRVNLPGQARVIHCQKIQIRHGSKKTTNDAPVEVLIGQKRDHVPFFLAASRASRRSRTPR